MTKKFIELQRKETEDEETARVSIRAEGMETETEGLAGRLKQLAQTYKSAAEFARACGFAESTMRKWMSGASTPNAERLSQIGERLGVSASWLVNGTDAHGRVGEENARYHSGFCSRPTDHRAPDTLVLYRLIEAVRDATPGAEEAERVDAVLSSLLVLQCLAEPGIQADALSGDDYAALASAVVRVRRASKSDSRKQG